MAMIHAEEDTVHWEITYLAILGLATGPLDLGRVEKSRAISVDLETGIIGAHSSV